MGFPRKEHWSGLPFPSPRDLPDPGIEPQSPALQAHSLPTEPPGKRRSFDVLLKQSQLRSASEACRYIVDAEEMLPASPWGLNVPHGNHPLALPHWDGGKWLLLNTKASCNNVQWVPSLFLYIIMLSSLVIPSTLIPNQHGFDPLSNFNCCPSSLLSLSFKLKSYPNFSLYILTSQPLFSFLFCVSYPQKNRCNACVMDEACNETNIYDLASKYKVIILWPQGCFPFQNILKEAE